MARRVLESIGAAAAELSSERRGLARIGTAAADQSRLRRRRHWVRV